ncbi:RHS repeat-associated core domain-containing protein, partial [Burkholderia stagnalis]
SLGRMVTASDRHMQAKYAYDALGRRIAKLTEPQVPHLSSAGSGWRDAERRRLKQEHGYGLTLYGWDGDTLAYETSWDKRETTHYVYEPGGFTPLARATGAAVLRDDGSAAAELTSIAYYHCDQIGTPQEVTDEAGEIAWSARYKAWGEAREVIGEAARKAGIENPLRFAGQYFDRETGLHYNRYRYYDPQTGRFVSKDPIGLAGGVNVYQYAPNPTGWVDPLGLSGFEPKVLTSGTVFRNASGTPDSLTPRLGKDTTRIDGKEPGLSAATSEAGLDSGKYVELDVGKLCSCGLQATHDKPNGHVTIRPINDPTDSKLTDWAKSRGSGSTHSLTEGILGAVTGRGKK